MVRSAPGAPHDDCVPHPAQAQRAGEGLDDARQRLDGTVVALDRRGQLQHPQFVTPAAADAAPVLAGLAKGRDSCSYEPGHPNITSPAGCLPRCRRMR